MNIANRNNESDDYDDNSDVDFDNVYRDSPAEVARNPYYSDEYGPRISSPGTKTQDGIRQMATETPDLSIERLLNKMQ